ncbi:MAG TPA: NUDIX hydrolase [Streptosporangiaceae bacterium]|nr:NUDIX hydrolase [Streptosporangiaceae bacterium]
MAGRSLTDARAWYAQLPTMYGSAGALITDTAGPSGRVLLVKPNYRDRWSIPGGIIEDGEAPHAGCSREVAEELGLPLPIGALLVVDWTPPDGVRPKPIVHFIFDGGVLGEPGGIRLQEDELDDWRFVSPGDMHRYLPSFLTARMTAALRARSSGVPVYLPAPEPRA